MKDIYLYVLIKKDMTNNYTVIDRGATGTIVYEEGSANVYKMYRNEQDFIKDLESVTRAWKIINSSLKDYKDCFITFLGHVSDLEYKDYHSSALVFPKCDGSLAHYLKRNKVLTSFQQTNLFIELLNIYEVLEKMNHLGISHNDFKDLNILYKKAPDDSIKLFIADYGDMCFWYDFPIERFSRYGYYYAFSPMMYFIHPLIDDNYDKFRTSGFNLDCFRQKIYHIIISVERNNRDVFKNITKDFPNYKKLRKQKYFISSRGRMRFEKYFKRIKAQFIEQYNSMSNRELDRKEIVKGVIRHNDLYGFGIILTNIYNHINEIENNLKRGLEEIIDIMTDTNEYFYKSIPEISDKFNILVRSIIWKNLKN